jgi:HAD superfamily hydrolase (TIGR01509 family)
MIFDFNGVLWLDNHLQEQAWNLFAWQMFGISLTSEVMAIQVHGRNNKHTLEYLAGAALDDMQVEQLSCQKEARYRSLCLAQGVDFKLSPGAIELLDAITARNIPRTIATASGKGNLLFFSEHLQLGRWFDSQLITFDDGVRPGKPAPDIYLQAAHSLGLRPTECVVVEDSISGFQAARAAGIGYIIALKPGDSNTASIELNGIDLVVENLTQIPWEDIFRITGPKASVEQNSEDD